MGYVIDHQYMVTPLARISVPGGDVLHAMKSGDPGYDVFGEAYFSTIDPGAVKGWKKHTKMVLNLVVPRGAVKVVLSDGEADFREILLDDLNHYNRLTVQPDTWFAFQGMATDSSLLLNIASIRHDPLESITRSLQNLLYPGFAP